MIIKIIFLNLLFIFAVQNINPVFAESVDINTADALTLAQNLKGVGLKNAERIVEFRTLNGPFRRIQDLAKVKGIGDKIVERNKQNILVSN